MENNATVYTINDKNEIEDSFKMEYNMAISSYWGKRTKNGRYHILPDGVACQYKKKKKILKNVIRQTDPES